MSVSNLQQKQTIMLSLVLKSNINVDIVISAHDTGLEQLSPGTLVINKLESQIINNVGSSKTKWPQHDSRNHRR